MVDQLNRARFVVIIVNSGIVTESVQVRRGVISTRVMLRTSSLERRSTTTDKS